jgi:UDPglucose 6-dehydrogenase
MREAPALVIIEKLLSQGCKVKAYDPVAIDEARRRIGDMIEYCKDPYEAAIDADAIMLLTEWTEFRFPNWTVIKKLIKKAVVFDGRNIYDREELKSQGYDYFCIGINTKL